MNKKCLCKNRIKRVKQTEKMAATQNQIKTTECKMMKSQTEKMKQNIDDYSFALMLCRWQKNKIMIPLPSKRCC